MANINIVKGEIGNALTSVAPDHILGVANDIFDESQQRYQQDINTELLGRSDGAYDISAEHLTEGNPTKYATLSEALGTNGANIPADKRKGGMSIKYIQTYDNNYVQYRYLPDDAATVAKFTNPANWQGVDTKPTDGSKNLVESGGTYETLDKLRFDVGIKVISTRSLIHVPFSLLNGHTYRFDNKTGVNAAIYLRVTESSTGQKLVNVNTGESVDVEMDADYNYIYIYTISSSETVYNIGIADITSMEVRLEDAEKDIDSLENTVTEINAKVDSYSPSINAKALGYDGVERFLGYISGTIWTVDGVKYKHRIYNVKDGDTVYVKAGAVNGSHYGFLKSYTTPVNSAVVDWCANTGRVVLAANAEATVTAPVDAKYLYVLSSVNTDDYTPQSLLVNNTDVFGVKNVLQKFEETNTKILGIKNDLSNFENSLIVGMKCSFTGAAHNNVTFNNPIVLSQNGDYIEILAQPDSGLTSTTSLYFGNSGESTNSYYSIQLSQNKIGLRAVDGTWIYQSKAITSSESIRLKIEYKDSNIYTYVNGTLVDTYSGQKTVKLASIGNGNNNNTNGWKGSVSSIVANGTELLKPGLFTASSDVIQEYSYKFDNSNLPKGVLSFVYTSSTNQRFIFYSRLGSSNKYFAFTIKLYVNDNDLVYLKEWRLSEGGLYEYANGIFSKLANTITDVENEMAMKFVNTADYTGGVHGDERIDVDNTCFAKFFADGKLLTDLSESFSVECSSFSYIQKSTLHQTTDDASTFVTGHPIIAYHLKNNVFKDCGFELENIIKFVSEQQVTQYHAGLMCIAKETASYALLPAIVTTPELTGTNNHYDADDLEADKVDMWNPTNEIKVSVSGIMLQGLNNTTDINNMEVWDRPEDSKYYRRFVAENPSNAKTFAQGTVIRNKQIVKFL